MKINVKAFLKDCRNTVIREKLINYRFFHEVKLSGVRSDRDIQISFPEIDKDGYDVVLDDGNHIRVIQIKTVLSDVSTKHWEIQKQLLRPNFDKLKILGFNENKNHSQGYQGGVVLIEVEADWTTIINFNYYYCDIFTLKMFECGLLRYKVRAKQKSIIQVLQRFQPDKEYNRYDGNIVVSIPRVAFLQAKDIDSLLILANLCSIKADCSSWRLFFETYLSKEENKRTSEDRYRITSLLKRLVTVENSNLIIE